MTSRLSKAPTASTNNRDLILILIHQERHIHKRHRLTIIAFIHRASIPQSHPSGQQRTSRSPPPPPPKRTQSWSLWDSTSVMGNSLSSCCKGIPSVPAVKNVLTVGQVEREMAYTNRCWQTANERLSQICSSISKMYAQRVWHLQRF